MEERTEYQVDPVRLGNIIEQYSGESIPPGSLRSKLEQQKGMNETEKCKPTPKITEDLDESSFDYSIQHSVTPSGTSSLNCTCLFLIGYLA